MRLDEVLQLRCTFEVHSLRLVVDLAVPEDFQDVIAKLLTVPVLAVAEFLLNGLEIDGLFHDEVIVRDIFEGDLLSEGP